jgi:peptide/nickel transport system substrate-binding protein
MLKRIIQAGAVILLLFLFTGLVFAKGETEKTAAGATDMLRVTQENPPKIFMPVITAGREEYPVFELLYGRLVKLDAEGKFVPSMAEKLDLSQDKLTWTITLRKDVKWHDGKPLTAGDVDFSLHAYVHKDLGKWWSGSFFAIKGSQEYNKGQAPRIEGVKVIDDSTIAITTSKPNVAFPSVLVDCAIVPKHIWEKVEKTEKAYAQFALTKEGTIGTGPYKFVQYVTDQYLEFERFDGYFDGRPKIKRIIIRFAPIDTSLAMLETGEVDMVFEIPYGDVERLSKVKGLVIEEVPNYKFVWWIRFNLWNQNPSPIKSFLQNPEFRKAVDMAFDKQAYVDSILLGHGKVVDTNAYSVGWAVPPDFKPTPYDPNGAKALFQKIGWNFDKNVIRILMYPSNKARDEVAGILQNYLRNIGVKAEIINKDLAAARVDMYETFDYDICIGGWLQGSDPSQWNLNLSGPSSGGGRGAEGYDNPKVNDAFLKAAQIFEFKDRQKAYWDIVKMIQADMPKAPICLPNVVIARTSKLRDFVLAPERGLGSRYIDVHKWSLAQ